jgi:predicted AlkP superfamily pyrophosphatase or phosphodiesterase
MLKLPTLFCLLLLICSCNQKTNTKDYKTKNVVVIVIDGPRYTETWGEVSRSNIPVRDSLLQEGVMISTFRNNGPTFTNPGHSAICTGNYENIANNGTQLPTNPSFLQIWLKSNQTFVDKCSIIASKDKLHVLANCNNPKYHNKYLPAIDCGVNGNGTGGYRSDSLTFEHIKVALANQQPNLLIINFKDPDFYGHAADSARYIQAIKNTDKYVGEIWKMLQNSPNYKDKTTLFVTNDHGRHLNGLANGFVSHGDACEGCRHIELFALSPDFKKNITLAIAYEQIDISATIAELMHFRFNNGKGRIMKDLFL